ncbi:MAG TPA: F0F1 ATP synthase subunit B [Dehalococcoidales bacterium]|nr:F0F1 ATP synthase subunit B [Dehalococcoidales bacterium]
MGELGINLPLLISQLISFLILLALLYFFVFKRVLRMLDDRSARIKESLEQAETVKKQSLQAEDEVKKLLQASSQKGQELVAQATRASEEIRAKAQELAKQDAEILIERARLSIQAEKEAALEELRKEFADVTILAAGKVINESLDKQKHKTLIDKVLSESQNLVAAKRE